MRVARRPEQASRVAGTIVAAFGRHYRVETDGGKTLLCYPRGKRSEFVCGDRVTVEDGDSPQGVIVELVPRNTLLYRSDQHKQRLIAANVTQVLIVVATVPPFSDELITRCIIAAESQSITVRIVLNKCDLDERVAAARNALAIYERLGYGVLPLSALHNASVLLPFLAEQTTLLIGQSGMGKSTLVNALVPGARAATRETSLALNAGKHTTTHARLYHLAGQALLIDSPGLMEFGLHHLSFDDIADAFVELRPLLGRCRFRNCRHDREPGCCIHAALQQGEVDARRYALFRLLANGSSEHGGRG